MEGNDAHLLNRTPLNHHLLPEIAPVVRCAARRLIVWSEKRLYLNHSEH